LNGSFYGLGEGLSLLHGLKGRKKRRSRFHVRNERKKVSRKKHFLQRVDYIRWQQGCQIILGMYMIPKAGKMYQMNSKYSKLSSNIRNVRKIFQRAIFQSKALQNLSKLGFLV
jgi:hypothetical protein